MLRKISVWNLGRMSYGKALRVQTQVANRIKELISQGDKPLGTVLLVEHDPVYTVGLRCKEYTPELELKLTRLGAEFFKTNRGGLITFHGPGQLVVYPIVYLKQLGGGMRWYVASLESIIIELCHLYGLHATTSVHTGVWVNDRKICAIGIHGSQQVVTHGLALNCCTDLEWFSQIVPCGIEGKGVTSLSSELRKTVSPADVSPQILQCFSKRFNCCLDETKDISTVDGLIRSI